MAKIRVDRVSGNMTIFYLALWQYIRIILCFEIGCDSEVKILISHKLEKPGSSDFCPIRTLMGRGTPLIWFFKLVGEGNFRLRITPDFRA